MTLNQILAAHSRNGLFLIAEAGTAHMSSLEKGKKLITEAAGCGASAVKFQYVLADEILHPRTGSVKLPGGDIDLYQTFKKLEQPPGFYKELMEFAKKNEILFLCTPFGKESARQLHKLGTPLLKIASPESNYPPLLDFLSAENTPALISTGISRLTDIEAAITRLQSKNYPLSNTCALQCITSYPAPPEEYNLLTLLTLPKLFKIPFGLSDHSAEPFLLAEIGASLTALISDCFIIEKHFTLDNDGDGLDDPFALAPGIMKNLSERASQIFSEAVKQRDNIDPEISSWLKTPTHCKPGLKTAAAPAAKIAEYISSITSITDLDLITSCLGDGIKDLAASEKDNYLTTNRSLRAVRDIKKGEKLSLLNCAFLRSEKNLKPGLTYTVYDNIKNLTAAEAIKDGEAVTEKNSVTGALS